MTTLRVPVGPGDHVAGPEDAPVTLVQYGDFECSFCGMAFPAVQEVRERMGDMLRFVFRHFPLAEAHTHAEHAAEISELAADSDRFWTMHDVLFTSQKALRDDDLVRYATELGLGAPAARAALERRTYAPRVRDQFVGGVRSGVNGTPTFFINGVRHDGSWEERELLAAIENAAVVVRR